MIARPEAHQRVERAVDQADDRRWPRKARERDVEHDDASCAVGQMPSSASMRSRLPAMRSRANWSTTLAFLDHVEAVGQARGEAEVLLHHQHGEAALAQHAGRSRRSSRRSPAPGPRSARRAAAAVRRCAGCGRWRASAARRPTAWCPGCCGAPSGSGTARRSRPPIMPPGISTGGSSRFSCAVQAGEDAALLGAVGHAEAGDRLRRQALVEPAVDARCRRCALLEQAHDGAQRGRLAGAVAAEQADDLAARAPRGRCRAAPASRRTRRQASRLHSSARGVRHGRLRRRLRSRAVARHLVVRCPRPAPRRPAAR